VLQRHFDGAFAVEHGGSRWFSLGEIRTGRRFGRAPFVLAFALGMRLDL
jgi:hypothetical protein